MRLTVKIKRFDPDRDRKPYWARYELDMDPADRVLDALQEIQWRHDPSLALRRSCAHGVCGSDAMLINGVNHLACKVLVKDVAPMVTVEPLPAFRVLKDLVVDMEPFFDAHRSIHPYLINDDPPPRTERLQSPEERELFDDTTKCILCACCTSSCPVYWATRQYVGPAAIVNAHRFIFDSRDQGAGERLDILNQATGVWRCRTVFNCNQACPREIDVTKAIEDVKRLLLSDRVW